MDIFGLSPTSLAPGAERPSAPADRRRGSLFVSAACRRVVSMRGWGKAGLGLFAAAALLALLSSSALAATTLTVTETTDAPLASGASTCESTDPAAGCTLRAAVELADAEGGEATIDVPEGTYKETATEPTLVIEDHAEVIISGTGAEQTIIEGEAKARVLEVEEGGSLRLDGVTVTNGGDEENGGAVFVSRLAELIVEDSTITENTATYGGGIYGEYLAYIDVVGSTIDENVADEDGGAIYGEDGSYVSVKESKITKNRANENGGGIASEPQSILVVDQSTIAKNDAEYDGGGIYAYMDEASCGEAAQGRAASRASGVRKAVSGVELETNLTIERSTIEGNEARWGGGIYAYEDREARCDQRAAADKVSARSAGKSVRPQTGLIELEPSLLIEQSTIAGNRADEFDESGGYGGGIYEEGSIDDPIINSTIAENFATNDGGGMAIAAGASAALVSDTVFDNTVEPAEIEIQGKSARRAVHRNVVEGTVGPGNNLATESEDAYALLRNTIVAEPSASVENCEGNFESLDDEAGYNLDYPSKALPDEPLDSCGMSSEEHDLLGEAPGLSEEGLASNGGPTRTIALLSSSPAIGFVPLSEDCDEADLGPSGVDQRGVARPGIPGKGCDIGAYEYQEPAKQEEPKHEEVKQEEVKKEEKAPAPAATGATSVLALKISSPAQCASKRDITIHIQNVKQFGIVSAVVSIDGHHKKTLSGTRLSTAINLRGLPPGTFTVEIVAQTLSGHTLKGERVYHTCHTKLPGQKRLRL
jgi:predicted outer membrane repeat protein